LSTHTYRQKNHVKKSDPFPAGARIPHMRILFICLCLASVGQAQSLFTAQTLRNDFTDLVHHLGTRHPGINRYTAQEALDKVSNQIHSRLNRPMTGWEFFRVIAEYRAAIKCGHTRFRPSASMQQELEKNGSFFPLPVQFAGTALYARLPDQSIQEVLTINGTPVPELLKFMFARFPTDGNAVDARYDMITESFWLYYAWLIDFSTPEFDITFRTSSGKESKKIRGVSFQQTASLKFYPDKSTVSPLLYYEQSGQVGYLSIKTFSSEEINASGQSYSKFLEETFVKIEHDKISQLIIDIRGNGGGDDRYGALLCSYVAKGPFHYFKKVYMLDGKTEIPVDHPCEQLQQQAAHAYAGKVVLLVDGRTFSTAADVASIFKSMQRGTLVGRETSGGYDGNTSGRSEQEVLTNTGIRVSIPLWYYENAVKPLQPLDRGVIPDFVVLKTLESIRNRVDLDRQTAIGILTKN